MQVQKLLLALSFFCFWATTSFANGIGIIDGSQGIYLSVVTSNVHAEVNNQIATITTTQVLKNNTNADADFKYAFPLNADANPISLRWNIGGVWYEADVSSSTQDNDIPGTGGGSGGAIDEQLATYLGASPLFFPLMNPIARDSTIIMELTYVELLPYFLGKVNFNYKNDISGLQDEIVEHQSFSFVLQSERDIVNIDLLGIASTDAMEPNIATIEYELHEAIADFDYTLEYELSSEGLGVLPLSTLIADSIFTCDEYGNGHLSLIIEPESNVDTEVIEKNFTLVIDRSGSMSGDKIVQARDAASFIVNNLNIGDNFNIIDFSSDVTSFFDSHVPFTIENQNAALNYIDFIGAGGSTNISGALTTAISQFQAVDPTKANIILFFTDGEATTGITDTPGILDVVQDEVNAAETSIFLFTFGIGEHVNRPLLTLLAQNNNGLVNFVKNEDLEAEITRFFLSINNPVLINTSITFEPDIINEVYPFPYPNLYKGQQLILSGRYVEPQTVSMHIEGQAFNVPVSYDFEFELADTSDATKSILPKIWAKQKIDALTLDFYLAESQEAAESIQADIDSISVCYEVISIDFTSFEDTGGGTTEIDEIILPDSKYRVQITPIPFHQQISIHIASPEPSYEAIGIEIYDAKGFSLLKRSSYLTGKESVFQLDDLQDLAASVYFCKIVIGGEILVFKIVKF